MSNVTKDYLVIGRSDIEKIVGAELSDMQKDIESLFGGDKDLISGFIDSIRDDDSFSMYIMQRLLNGLRQSTRTEIMSKMAAVGIDPN